MGAVSNRYRMCALAGLTVASIVALAGCPPQPVGPAASSSVTLHVINNSSDDVAYLYVSPASSDTWGADILGPRNVIPPGSSWPVSVAPGVYDVKVEDFDHNPIRSLTGVRLTQDSEWVLYDQ